MVIEINSRKQKIVKEVKATEKNKQAVSKISKWNRTKVDVTRNMDWYQIPEGVPTVFSLI